MNHPNNNKVAERSTHATRTPKATPKAHRSSNWTPLENRALCSAFIRASDNEIAGSNRSSSDFFNDVLSQYLLVFEEGRIDLPVTRSVAQIRARWNIIQAAVMKFVGVLEDVLALNENRTTFEDKYQKALRSYEQEHASGKTFMFEDCYNILKDHPKWKSIIASKNGTAADSVASSVAVVVSSTAEENIAENYRPDGRKASKRRATEGPCLASVIEEHLKGVIRLMEKRQRSTDKSKRWDRLLVCRSQDYELILTDTSSIKDAKVLAFITSSKKKAIERLESGIYDKLDNHNNYSEEEQDE